MNTASKRQVGLPLLAGAMLFAGVGAFLMGRGTAVTTPPPATHEHAAEGNPEEPKAEAGVVRFEPESLRRAGVKTAAVGYTSTPSQLSLTGSVEADQSGVVRITPRTAGKISTLRVNVGDTVSAGQVLATLTSTELAEAQSAYRQATSRIELARLNLRRQRQLAGLGEFGRHKVEEARRESVASLGEIKISQNEVAAGRNEVAEARSEQAARQSEQASAEAEASSAESEIAEAESQVRALQAGVAQAQTGLEVAQSRFNRAEVLLKEQLVSKQDWEQSRAEAKRAASDVDAARANLAQGQSKITTARAHLKVAQAKARAAASQAQQAAARIETALSRQAQAEERLAAGRKREEIAAQSLAREEKVFRGGFFTSKEIVEAEGALRQAELEQRGAAERVRLLGGMLRGDNTLTVSSPIAGRVTERAVTAGEMVSPEKPLLTVVNLNTVWVQLSLHQADVSRVRVGQSVSVSSDSAPGRTFTGTVSYLADQVDEASRTLKVRCVVQNAAGVLKPQTFVRGLIRLEERQRAIAVPQDAVQELDGKPVVFVPGTDPGEFRSREVTAGETRGGQTLVLSGLRAGERVVTQGAFVVKSQAMKAELGEE